MAVIINKLLTTEYTRKHRATTNFLNAIWGDLVDGESESVSGNGRKNANEAHALKQFNFLVFQLVEIVDSQMKPFIFLKEDENIRYRKVIKTTVLLWIAFCL